MQIGSTPPPPPGPSPRDQAISSLDEKVEAGEISADDKDAMLEALDAMNEERKAAGRPESGSPPPTREEMQANFETLLSDQVDAGTLTEEQADELSAMFEEGELGKPKGPGGPGGPQGGEQGSRAEELLSAILSELQSQSAYDENGENNSDVSALVADFQA
ncbi:hypothetical protein [Roseibium sp.]|uniref:hypothetical protein n=1 Tax=Roseibium sp. TaxID=1936156 RepID=UPI003B52E85C